MLERVFRVTERGSTLGREVRGELVTFVTMAYIVDRRAPLYCGSSPVAFVTYFAVGPLREVLG